MLQRDLMQYICYTLCFNIPVRPTTKWQLWWALTIHVTPTGFH